MHTMMLQNVPSIELNRRLLQNEINSRRVAQILVEASQPDLDQLPNRNRSRITSYGDPDPHNVTAASAGINWSADEFSEAVTTARYVAAVTRRSGGNAANRSVNLSLARKRTMRTVPLNRVTASLTNAPANKGDFTALNRTASASVRPPATASWNLSLAFVNRTNMEDKSWNTSNTTSAITDTSTSQSVYCPAIPPGLRELWLLLAFSFVNQYLIYKKAQLTQREARDSLGI